MQNARLIVMMSVLLAYFVRRLIIKIFAFIRNILSVWKTSHFAKAIKSAVLKDRHLKNSVRCKVLSCMAINVILDQAMNAILVFRARALELCIYVS